MFLSRDKKITGEDSVIFEFINYTDFVALDSVFFESQSMFYFGR
jgi:hypothetical protein